MNSNKKGFASLLTATTAALMALIICVAPISTKASGGKTTDTGISSGGSKSGGSASGGGSGGGGGGGSHTAATPISSATLTFSASSSGACTGSYQILPYYPTLLDLMVNVNVSGFNVPDGTVLYVNAFAVGGSGIYPYLTAPMTVVGGACSSSQHYFIYPNVAVAGVTISDAAGNIVFAGN